MTESSVPSSAPAGDSPQDDGAVRLYGAAVARDPDTLYRELRRDHGPVVPVLLDGDVPAWFVVGYREVNHITSNPMLFARDCRRWNAWDQVPDDWPLMPYVGWTPSVMFAEGEEHQRRAGAIGDALDAVHRTELAAICEELADGLIDEFAGTGEADLVDQYSHRIPLLVIARLFGLPDSDVPALVQDVAESLDADEKAVAAHQRIQQRMTDLVAERRQRPGPDFPSRLLAHPAGLSAEEVIIDLLVVMAAAQQPTGNWIGNALRLMLVDDHFSMTFQGGRSSVDQALTQVLWEDTPTQNFIGRWAVHGCRLGGRDIRAGDLLVMGLAAANADPQVRPEAGAATGNRAHLSFGHGEHGCPFPAPEHAEVIARTAIEVLLDRLPDIELAVAPDGLEWRPSFWMRGLHSLPVTFSPAAHRLGAVPFSPGA
ncbi:cytochrome P450 [Actinomadura livida]|uniref:Cytochrome P450 n=1 Tax=Actinomadura livida TaxID=79909 RepID=A0A7W7I8W8_9ACTN|nr:MULTISPECIES: cytochrome P450 [Actinomadura]MBB4772691.1 cytochrome P450 [Actinomadura catellatispora]GGU12166.1 cytochrome P450 [Actinomadura livida]